MIIIRPSSHFLSQSPYLSQRAGAVFPQRSEMSAPVFTPPQTQPLTAYPHNLRNLDNQQETAESSAESEFPTLRYICNSFSIIYMETNPALILLINIHICLTT